MGIALDIVRQSRTGAVRTVVLGCLLVVGVGVLFSAVVPIGYDLLQNAQFSGRTSPGLMDLVAALATGAAGAVGLARRDGAPVPEPEGADGSGHGRALRGPAGSWSAVCSIRRNNHSTPSPGHRDPDQTQNLAPRVRA